MKKRTMILTTILAISISTSTYIFGQKDASKICTCKDTDTISSNYVLYYPYKTRSGYFVQGQTSTIGIRENFPVYSGKSYMIEIKLDSTLAELGPVEAEILLPSSDNIKFDSNEVLDFDCIETQNQLKIKIIAPGRYIKQEGIIREKRKQASGCISVILKEGITPKTGFGKH